MKFEVRNYRKIKTATIEADSKITFIGGINAAGKSSLIDATRCALTGQANPFKEITKKQSSMLVHSGSPSGMVKMINGDNELNIKYPEQEETTTGIIDVISNIASGIESFVDNKPNERLKYISDMMKSEPGEIDLIEAIKKAKIFPPTATIGTTKAFQELWENIELNGWDNAYKTYKEKGAEAKGVWKYITGKSTYGKLIAEQWKPDAWTIDLENVKLPELEKEFEKQKEFYEASIKSNAIEDSERESLIALVGTTTEVEKERLVFKEKHDALEEKRIGLVQKPDITGEIRGLICPSCQEALSLSNGELRKIPKDEKIIDNSSVLKDIKKEQTELLIKIGEKQAELKRIETAQKTLNESVETDSNDNKSDVTVEYQKAVERFEAFKNYHEALTKNKQIINNQKIQAILKPDGLRADKLKKALDIINKNLKTLSGYAGWDAVEIDKKGEVTYKGVPYGRFIAKSERYRTNVLIQFMIALQEKAVITVVDDADELTGSVRSGLIKIILKSGMNTIIACALKNKTELPDLGKFGGKSYWVNEGVVE
jgi:hypothetical protein